MCLDATQSLCCKRQAVAMVGTARALAKFVKLAKLIWPVPFTLPTCFLALVARGSLPS